MGLRRFIGRTQIPVLADVVLASRVVLARWKSGVRMDSRPGEFGSPIADLRHVRKRDAEIFDVVGDRVQALDLREEAQLELVARFRALYADQPFGRALPGLRYRPDNGFFGVGAAFVLHCMLRLFQPRRLVEVGSGYSSAVVLDTRDRFLDAPLQCTFVDPYPERLLGLLREGDALNATVIAEPVQRVLLSLFEELAEGDVLFIDSSHVSKVGSDLNWLLFEVLPRLAPGVLVHFHDIYYPFEYPKQWIYEGRAWTENYLLRAFLMYNTSFEIVLFNSYLEQFHRDAITSTMPIWGSNIGTSLWLRRTTRAGLQSPMPRRAEKNEES